MGLASDRHFDRTLLTLDDEAASGTGLDGAQPLDVVAVEEAAELVGRVGGIEKLLDAVEDSAQPELVAQRQQRVPLRRETAGRQVSDTDRLHHAPDIVRFQVVCHTQSPQNRSRPDAGLGWYVLVAVEYDWQPGLGQQDRERGGQLNRVHLAVVGRGQVKQPFDARLDLGDSLRPQQVGEAANLVDRLALDPLRDEKGAGLRR